MPHDTTPISVPLPSCKKMLVNRASKAKALTSNFHAPQIPCFYCWLLTATLTVRMFFLIKKIPYLSRVVHPSLPGTSLGLHFQNPHKGTRVCIWSLFGYWTWTSPGRCQLIWPAPPPPAGLRAWSLTRGRCGPTRSQRPCRPQSSPRGLASRLEWCAPCTLHLWQACFKRKLSETGLSTNSWQMYLHFILCPRKWRFQHIFAPKLG